MWCLCEECGEESYGRLQDPTSIVDQSIKEQPLAGLTSEEGGSKVVRSDVDTQEKSMVRFDARRGTRVTPTGGRIIGSCPWCLKEGEVGMICTECNQTLGEALGLCSKCGTCGQQLDP